MKFIKKNIKVISAFIIGVVLTGGIVGATVYQYQASDVKYGGTTVGAAINDLYGSVNAQGTTSYGRNIDSLLYNSTTSCGSASCSYICPSGKTCVAFASIGYVSNNGRSIFISNKSGTVGYICYGTQCDNYLFNTPIYLAGNEEIYVNNGSSYSSYPPSLKVFSLK